MTALVCRVGLWLVRMGQRVLAWGQARSRWRGLQDNRRTVLRGYRVPSHLERRPESKTNGG